MTAHGLDPGGRYCPTCGALGNPDGADGLHVCNGPSSHRFWIAIRRCGCGFIPVCPSERDVWVCVNCEQWEAVPS